MKNMLHEMDSLKQNMHTEIISKLKVKCIKINNKCALSPHTEKCACAIRAKVSGKSRIHYVGGLLQFCIIFTNTV